MDIETKNGEYKGPERRSYNRIRYNPQDRANLRIESDFFEVVDICESGLRFINDREIPMEENIRGTLTFLSGKRVDIAGSVRWEKNDTFGIQFKILLPSELIISEMRHLQGS